MLHLQHIIGRPLDVLCDLMSMGRPEQERAQNEHIQRPLQ